MLRRESFLSPFVMRLDSRSSNITGAELDVGECESEGELVRGLDGADDEVGSRLVVGVRERDGAFVG